MKSISSFPAFRNLSRSYIVLALLGIILFLSFNLLPIFPVVTFKNFQNTQMAELLNGVFWATLVVERSLEVFIAAWRNGKIIELEEQINAYKKSRDEVQALKVENELYRHKQTTKELAIRTGFFVGIIASLLGFRVLEPLVEIGNIPLVQQKAFRILDIILTGLTISGGSNFFHSLISVITDFISVTREKIQNTKHSSDTQSNNSSKE